MIPQALVLNLLNPSSDSFHRLCICHVPDPNVGTGIKLYMNRSALTEKILY